MLFGSDCKNNMLWDVTGIKRGDTVGIGKVSHTDTPENLQPVRCYRWLAKQLRGFDTAAPKQLYRKFVETAGVVEIQSERLVVHFDKRCHNPILREAALDQPSQVIPWLRNLPVVFQYP